VPFHLYSMRQAIEEGFILDVLANYVTYQTYWNIENACPPDDPEYDPGKAGRRSPSSWRCTSTRWRRRPR
jgi:type I restriction enzyme R subunit